MGYEGREADGGRVTRDSSQGCGDGYPELPLPTGIRARFVPDVNGLRMHLLEAGWPESERCVLLLHGFPELAFSWRYLMPELADAGYYVVAPDLRGYGRTTGDNASGYEDDPIQCSALWLVNDLMALVAALGRERVDAVVGHDSGSIVAAWCGLVRSDVFRAVMMMSAPFAGPPSWPMGRSGEERSQVSGAVARLPELGREHYQWYYSSPRAARDMDNPEQGMRRFLRAYFHMKSADWHGNEPYELERTDAEALAELPEYYVMPLGMGMPVTVAREEPSDSESASCKWLSDGALAVYANEFSRTGFQGALQWYRCRTSARQANVLRLFGGLGIDVPTSFVAGERDWGVHQVPGAYAAMQRRVCTRMLSCNIVRNAGHWVQQEQPTAVLENLMRFLDQINNV